MNSFVLFAGGYALFIAVAGIAIFKFHSGLVPKYQVFAIAAAGITIMSALTADLVFLSRDRLNSDIQTQIDAATAHSADLGQRIYANVAAMKTTLAEQRISQESPSIERDQAWQKRVGDLAKETGELLKERDALVQEIGALQPAIAAAAADHLFQKRFTNLFVIAVTGYLTATGLTLLVASRKRRFEIRAAKMRAQGLDPMALSDRVKRLADEGRKIAAIKAYREESGASLLEAKNNVENYMAHA